MSRGASSTPACPACGADGARPAFSAADWSLRAAPGEFHFSRCPTCATVFADPQPADDVLAAAYGADYGNYRPGRSLVERIVEPIVRREAVRVAAVADPGSPMIELGCGTGRFLERLEGAGWTGRREGVEYSPAVAEMTASRVGVPVRAGTVEEADLGPEPHGLIVLRHVIEHLRDPGAALRRLRGGLRDDGVLYLATPDARALAAAAFGRYWWGYEVPRHLVVFSRNGLRRLVESSGFEVIGEWWSFSPQMWNASLYLALDRGRGSARISAFTHLLNPLVTGPAILAATAEVALRRSTMYGLLARPRR